MVSIAMTTIPQKLIEFRYFIIPYMMIRSGDVKLYSYKITDSYNHPLPSDNYHNY